MDNIFIKPWTEDYSIFAAQVQTNGQRIEEDEVAYYALYPNQRLLNGEIVDSPCPIFSANQLAVKKIDLLNEIAELEKSQLRAVRELIIDPTSTFPLNKLKSIDSQIQDLRTQIEGL